MSINQYTFQDCTSLTSVTIPDNVEIIGRNAFSGCTSLENVTIPANIYLSAFYGCKNLVSVIMLNGVETIEEMAFYRCENLKSVIIPNTVTTIGKSAFASSREAQFYLYSTTPPILEDYSCFYQVEYAKIIIHVPVGSGNVYKNATNWSRYRSKIVEDIEI